MDPSPTIAIVGRPNVGKSTLFNRLTGSKHAITTDIPGTTRDRITKRFDCNGIDVMLVDTGGLEYGQQDNIEGDVQAQANIAISEADLILFTINAQEELTVDDFAAADILRKSKKPVILIANKCDNPSFESNTYNIYELGFGEAIQVSAIHKNGMETLQSMLSKNLKELGFKPASNTLKNKSKITNICILGKPNAGKSSLVNALLGSEKVIVSDIPGTTRDSIDLEITYNEKKYNLIDTAGLRRRGKIDRGIEKYSAMRALSSIERSDIVVLLIDSKQGITNQDTHILQFAMEAEKGVIIALNKIDLFEKGEDEKDKLIGWLRRRFAFIPWAPIIFVSAKNKKNTYTILELSDEIMEERRKQISTKELVSFLQKITFKHPPASTKTRKPKFKYGTQVATEPPKFVMFFKNAPHIHFSYKRYLENELRREYGFNGTAIHLRFRDKENPEGKDPKKVKTTKKK